MMFYILNNAEEKFGVKKQTLFEKLA